MIVPVSRIWRRLLPIVHAGCAAGLFVAAHAEAQHPPPAAAVPAIERFTLANGLSVVLERDARQPTVAGAVVYRVGARDDPPGYSGLAHLVEHMAFRGSVNLPDRGGWKQYAAIGAQCNGMTTPDHTIYFAEFSARYLPHFLWVESERMAFTLASMSESVLEVERKVVLNEYRQSRYQQRIVQTVRQTVSPENHPYRTLAEKEADPEALGFDDVRSFFQRYYRPDNAVLVLVGQLDPARTRALIEQYFGTLKVVGKLHPRPPAPAIAFEGAQRLRFAAPRGLSELRLLWSIPCGRDISCHAQIGLLDALIERALAPEVETAGPFRSARVALLPFEDHVELEVRAPIAPGATADEALAAIDRELERVRSGRIEAQELRMVQHAHMTSHHYAQESFSGRAIALIMRPEARDEAAIAAAGRMTVHDIAAAATALLPRDRRLVVEIRSAPSAPFEGALEDSQGQLSPRSVRPRGTP